MRAPLTDFGRQNLTRLSRLRVAIAAGALAVALGLRVALPTYPIIPLALLLLLETIHGIVLLLLEPRAPPRPLVQAALCIDTLILCGVVLFTGGLAGGFASVYVWIVIAAGLVLGVSAIPYFGALVLLALFTDLALEGSGAAAPILVPLPVLVTAASQFVLVALLVGLAYLLVRYRQESVERLEGEKTRLLTERVQAEQSAHDVNLLFEAGRATSSTLDLRQVIARLLEQMVRAFDLTSAYFNSVDEARQIGRIEQEFFGPAASPGERQFPTRTYRLADFPRVVKMLHAGTDVQQLDDADLTPAERASMQESDGRTVLRIPLRSPDRMLGYVALWESRAPRRWTDRELRLAEAMAAQAATAIRNARSYEDAHSRSRELQALHAAGQLLNSSLSVGEICRVGVEAVREHLGYNHVAVYFATPEELHLQFERGYPVSIPVIPLTRGIMARAARARQPILIEDVAGDPDYIAVIPGMQSEIAIPLIRSEQVLGVLNVETMQPRRLEAADVRVLTTFANQLVIAIDNARLFEETQQRLAELDTLHRAGQALSADLTLEGVLNRVADYFLRLLAVDTCTIASWDPLSQDFAILLDRDSAPGSRVHPGARLSGSELVYARQLVDHHATQVYYLDNPETDRELSSILRQYDWSTLIVLPLESKGKLVGLIELGARGQHREFGPDQVRVTESLGSQAAIAIENARLFADAARRLEETRTLYEFTAALGQTTSLSALGQRALDSIARVIPFDLGAIGLGEEPGRVVPLVIGGRLAPGMMHSLVRDTLHGGRAQSGGVIAWVAEHGRPLRLGNVSHDPRYAGWLPDIRSALCVPLRSGERVIGVLNLESKKADAFDEDAERLLVTFANPLAMAIINAQLYEQTHRDAEVKAALLREVSHRVKNNLAAITSLLQLALAEAPEKRERILQETLARAQSLVAAHTLLARSNQARINVVDLGEQILQDSARTLAPLGSTLTVRASGDPAELVPRQLTTVALILNELATNAITHGLGSTIRDGCLEFRSQRISSGALRLSLSDNGDRLPQDLEKLPSPGMGLMLVRTLVEKDLQGSFTIERHSPWTTATIEFELES